MILCTKSFNFNAENSENLLEDGGGRAKTVKVETKALKIVKESVQEEPLKTVEIDAKTLKTVAVDCNDPSSVYILSDL